MSAKKLLLTPHYLPTTAYFTYLFDYAHIVLEAHAFYEKQSYANRCYIMTSQGVQKLVVPIRHSGGKQRFQDVKVDYSTPWYRKHQQALATAYGKAPFFHSLRDFLFPIFDKKLTFLIDINYEMLTAVLDFLQLKREVTHTESYSEHPVAPMVDRRHFLHPKKRNICAEQRVPRYCHLFGDDFVPHLSIIDLLFCEGPFWNR
ncbi:MAG: WbqC family protein [Bacteroidota bacterium]